MCAKFQRLFNSKKTRREQSLWNTFCGQIREPALYKFLRLSVLLRRVVLVAEAVLHEHRPAGYREPHHRVHRRAPRRHHGDPGRLRRLRQWRRLQAEARRVTDAVVLTVCQNGLSILHRGQQGQTEAGFLRREG